MSAPQPLPVPAATRTRRLLIAGATLLGVCAMIGMSYAAVPLYAAFCKATGYGGTTQVATSAPQTRGSRKITVRFNANIAPGLPWTFEPEAAAIDVLPGETVTAFYKIRNTSSAPTAATAGYNVSPDISGAYFNKIACFCFTEQHLGPNETAELPVVFFLDPALERDEIMRSVDSVTLSYTFYATKTPVKPVAANTKPGVAQPQP